MTPEEKFKRLRYLELKSKMGAAKAAATMNDLAPPERKDPGALRSLALGVAQGGTSDFADEIGGAAGSVLIGDGSRLTPQAKAELLARGEKIPDQRGGYELARDNVRDEDQRAQDFNPGINMAGRVGGGLASAYVLPGGAPKTVAGMMKVGAGFGALGGLGSSEADIEGGEYGRALLDMGVGAGTGATLSGGLGAGIKAAPSLLRYLGDNTRQVALNKGRNVLLNGADQLSNNAPIPEAAVLRALNEGHIKPFGTTQGTATRLEKALNEAGGSYGAHLEKLQDLGAPGFDAMEVAQQYLARARELRGKSGDPRLAKMFEEEAENIINATANNAQGGSSGLMPLKDAEFYKRTIQGKAKYNKVEDTPLNPYRKEAAATVRQAIEDSVDKAGQSAGKGSEIANAADAFVPLKTRYGELAQALAAAEKGVARGSQKTASALMPDTLALSDVLGGAANPAAMLAKPATGALKQRLPSTLAVGGMAVADALRTMSKGASKLSMSGSGRATAAKAGGLSTEEAQAIAEWLRTKKQE